MSDVLDRSKLYTRQLMDELKKNCSGMDASLMWAVIQDEISRAFFVGYSVGVEVTKQEGRR